MSEKLKIYVVENVLREWSYGNIIFISSNPKQKIKEIIDEFKKTDDLYLVEGLEEAKIFTKETLKNSPTEFKKFFYLKKKNIPVIIEHEINEKFYFKVWGCSWWILKIYLKINTEWERKL